MFGLFKNNRKKKKPVAQMMDLDGNSLQVGDTVLSYRYELGNCVLVDGENGIEYESVSSKKRVNWTLMIDAATDRQKVRKLDV